MGLALDPDGPGLTLGIADREPLPGKVAAEALLPGGEGLARIPADAGDLGVGPLGNEVEVLRVLPSKNAGPTNSIAGRRVLAQQDGSTLCEETQEHPDEPAGRTLVLDGLALGVSECQERCKAIGSSAPPLPSFSRTRRSEI
jgi:hypothetical protein